MSQRRVVITGLGQVSPVGNSVAEAWNNLLAGKSGIGKITRFDASDINSQIAGEVRDFNIGDYISAKEARRMDVFIHYGIAAALQAIADSGLDNVENLDKDRVGVNIGSGIGGLPSIEATGKAVLEGGARKINPFFIPGSLINLISGHVTILKGYRGPSYGMVSACTTGAHSIGDSARLIKYGDADVMIAGGAEGAISTLGVGGFAAMKALSTRNDDPATASRPWDKGRDGFVIGEGAGVLVLEELEHAYPRTERCRTESQRRRLRQRAWYLHSAGRCQRNQSPQARTGRPRPQSYRQLHQIHDRPPARRCRRCRSVVQRVGNT